MINLSETFDLVKTDKQQDVTVVQKPKQNVSKKAEPKIESVIDEYMLQDYLAARNNFDTLMEMGKNAFENLTQIAEQSQDPRAYRVIAELVKSLSDTNREYLEMYKKIAETKKINAESGFAQEKRQEGGMVIDKAVFIGTSSELLNQIKPRNIIDGTAITE